MLGLRNMMKNVYAEYDLYILPVLKYAIALFTFLVLNQTLGYMEVLNGMVPVLVLSAICAILPWNAIPVIGVCMVILHCFALGLEVGGCAAGLYLMLLIFYFRFVPKDGLALTLTAATCSLGLPGIVPISLGLKRGPLSALTMICNMISWFFIRVVTEVVVPMKASPEYSLLDGVKAILNAMLNNSELFVYAISLAAVVLLVSLIRSSGVSWSWEISIIAGGILQVGLLTVMGNMMGISMEMSSLIVQTVIAMAVSFVLCFFVYNVDYKGSERFQFEDDEYVYYVKAIPKKVSDAQISGADDEEDYEENLEE